MRRADGCEDGGSRRSKERSLAFGESVSACFRKFTDFTGRAARPEFWYFVLFMWLIHAVLFAVTIPGIDFDARDRGFPAGFFVLVVVSLVFLLPYLAVTVRRLHDTYKSGALILIGLIPFVGGIILLVFLATAGTPGPNRYGPDPGTGPYTPHPPSPPPTAY